MRAEELIDRPGKQEDGSSRTLEVKVCILWSAEKTDGEGIPVRDEGSSTYPAAIGGEDCQAANPTVRFAQRSGAGGESLFPLCGI